MLYQQGHDAEAKQIEDSIKSLASKTDVEIAARHFQAAIDNLSRLPANDIATFQRVDKIIKAEIDAKDANAIANAATALAKLIPNSVFWQRQQPLQVAIDLDEAGYDKDAKAILAAAAENANVCAGAMRVAALKWIRSAYTEINDPQDAATFDSRIQAAELAYQTRPRPQAPAAVPSEADLERGKRIVKAIKELNAPNDGSDEQTAAALERASDALGDDRAMLGTVLFMAGMQRAGQERPLREKLHNFIEARQFKEAIDATSAFSGPAKINALIAVEHAQEKVGTFQDAYDTIKLMDDRQSRIDARLNLVAAITNTTHQ
jgi:hypothetical protein